MLKTFAVIGDPIEHSLSPTIHNAAFRQLGLECTYIAYRVSKDQLEEEINSLKKIKISGFNVTIPHKINVLKYLEPSKVRSEPSLGCPGTPFGCYAARRDREQRLLRSNNPRVY